MKRSGVLIIVLVLIASLTFLVGCGNNAGGGGNAGGSSGGEQEDATPVVKSLTVDSVSFTLNKLDTSPTISPADMPEGNSPFLVMLDYTGNGDVETALGTLHNDASLLVNGQEVGIPTTAFNVKEGFVTLFSSTPDDLEAAGLSIELVYDNEKLVVR